MRNKNQRGAALLIELLCVCIISVVLAAISVPSFVGMMKAQNQVAAHKRISLVTQAQAEIAICSVNNTCSAAAVAPLVPAPGSTVVMGGYVFVMTQAGSDWTYTATPQTNQTGVYAYYVSNDSVVRCDIGTA